MSVVPTRNAAEGFAALLALDPAQDAAANVGPMTEAGRAIQSLVVTEAVRDATIGGRKVKRGQTIALDPDDGLVAVNNDREKCVLAAMAALTPGYELVTLFYGDGADLAEAEAMAQSDRHGRAGHRGRGAARRAALLPVPHRGRVARGQERPADEPPARHPTDPVELLRRRSSGPGWPRARNAAGRDPPRTSTTVRDLLFHLPRRYDDLREMQPAPRPVHRAGRDRRSRPRRRSADVRVEPGFRRRSSGPSPGSRTIPARSTRPGSGAASSSGGCGRQRGRRLGQGQALRSELTFDNPEFQASPAMTRGPARGRIVPVYPLTAGLTAARLRTGDPRGARQGRSRLPRVPAGRDRGRGRRSCGSPGRSRKPTTRRPSRAATRRWGGWPSTSSWRCSSGWSSGAANGSATRRRS